MNVAKEAFSNAISLIRKDFGLDGDDENNMEEKEAMASNIVGKFQQAFDAPPVIDMEHLNRKTFVQNEVRIVLFCPLEDHIQYYVNVLDRTQGISDTMNNLARTRNLLLSLVYLIHR